MPMSNPSIRKAGAVDLARVAACVDAAFGRYVTLIGEPPAPMLDDHGATIAEGRVFLAEVEGSLGGVLVTEGGSDGLLVEILAVHPDRQRQGLGARLMAFAEAEARRLGLPRVYLYTHQLMSDALEFYAALGYVETERRTEQGYERVYLAKDIDTDRRMP